MGVNQSVVQDVAPYSLPVDVPHESKIVQEEYTPLVRKMIHSPNFVQLVEIHKASADVYQSACPEMVYQVGGKTMEKVIEELTPLGRSPSFGFGTLSTGALTPGRLQGAHGTPRQKKLPSKDATPLLRKIEEAAEEEGSGTGRREEHLDTGHEEGYAFARILTPDEATSPRRLDLSPTRRQNDQPVGALGKLTIPEIPTGPAKSPIRRHPLHTQALSGRIPGCDWKTAWDIFQTGKERNAENPCLGQRKFISDNQRGEYEWLTYQEVESLSLQLATSLLGHELCPMKSFIDEEYYGARHLRPLGIYAKNCVEWFVLEQACNAVGITLVPLYDTLGTEAIVYIINQTRMNCIVASVDCLTPLQPVLKETTTVEHVIILDLSKWICCIFQNGTAEGMATLKRMCDSDNITAEVETKVDNVVVEGLTQPVGETATHKPSVEKLKSGKSKTPRDIGGTANEGIDSFRDEYLQHRKSLAFFLEHYPLCDLKQTVTSKKQEEDWLNKETTESNVQTASGMSTGPSTPTSDVENSQIASSMQEVTLSLTVPSMDTGASGDSLNKSINGNPSNQQSPKSVLFSTLLLLGAHDTMKPLSVIPESVQTLCYTSGTTGNPKGVIITHGAFVTAVAGNIQMITMSSEVLVQSTDRHISYLPLAHIYERIVSNLVLFAGAKIGLYSGNAQQVLDDLKALKPTLFVAVPRIYSRIIDQVMVKVAAAGSTTQWLFNKGLQTKLQRLRDGGKPRHSLWDNMVFNKVREQIFGNDLRFCISGGAAIDQSVQELVQVLFGVTLMQGYGLTETLGPISMTRVNNTATGHVGGILPSCEFYLEAVEEMGACPFGGKPSGEVVVRSHGLSKGYFRNAELTREVFTRDGWFHTGDVGELLPNGALKIVDRKKNIFKLSQGEYVAPEKIEGVYCQSSFVSQIFVYGYSDKDHLVGIVVPDPQVVMPWAKTKDGLKAMSFVELIKESLLKTRIATEMETVAKTAGLKGFEKVRAFELVAEAFTVENGLLTPTMKLKRPIAAKHYRDVIDQLYSA